MSGEAGFGLRESECRLSFWSRGSTRRGERTLPAGSQLHAHDDQNHVRCKKALKTLQGPFFTVWPVFTEATYLLNFSWKAQDALWEMIHREFFTLVPLD
jgi:hypothetical protein